MQPSKHLFQTSLCLYNHFTIEIVFIVRRPCAAWNELFYYSYYIMPMNMRQFCFTKKLPTLKLLYTVEHSYFKHSWKTEIGSVLRRLVTSERLLRQIESNTAISSIHEKQKLVQFWGGCYIRTFIKANRIGHSYFKHSWKTEIGSVLRRLVTSERLLRQIEREIKNWGFVASRVRYSKVWL